MEERLCKHLFCTPFVLVAVQEERTFPPAKLAKTVMTQDAFQPPPNAAATLMQNGSVINLAALPQTTVAASLPGLQTMIPSISPYTYQYITQSPAVQLVGIPMHQPVSQAIFAPRMMLTNQMALPSTGPSLLSVSQATGMPVCTGPPLSVSSLPMLTTQPASPDDLLSPTMADQSLMKHEPVDTTPNLQLLMTNGSGVDAEMSPSLPPSPGIDLDAMVARCKGRLATDAHRGADVKSLLSGESTAPLLNAVRQVVDWANSIPAFMRLPVEAQCKALQNCWVEQLCLHLVYCGASTSGGRETSGGMPMAKLAKEVGRTVRKLELDDKDVICLRLLLLFNAGKLR